MIIWVEYTNNFIHKNILISCLFFIYAYHTTFHICVYHMLFQAYFQKLYELLLLILRRHGLIIYLLDCWAQRSSLASILDWGYIQYADAAYNILTSHLVDAYATFDCEYIIKRIFNVLFLVLFSSKEGIFFCISSIW